MTNERFEKIKENAYMRCNVANYSGIGLTSSDKEELELIKEVDRLNNIINEFEIYLVAKFNITQDTKYLDDLIKLKELKEDK